MNFTDVSTVEADGRRKWVYPLQTNGVWTRRRELVAWLLIAFLFVVPWTKMAGNQTIQLNFFEGKLHFFGLTLWANENIVVLGFIFFFMASILTLTAVLGRVFCGWACPMPVFLEFVFRPIERLIEGQGAAQRKFHSLSFRKRFPKSAFKLLIFAIISLLIANTMVAYVHGREVVLQMIYEGPFVNWWAFVGMLIVFGLVFFQFSWFREQMCTFVCPYGRLQSLLLDKDSIIVAYDINRGEPRGKVGQAEGDCVDCKQCVRVCPTGIDIRNGLQLECLHCTACMDACDDIMAKLNRKQGLIRYQTENEVEGLPRRVLRPRLAIYAALMVLASGLMWGFGAERTNLHATIHREFSSQVFTIDPEGRVVNAVRVHLRNRTDSRKALQIVAKAPAALEVVVPEGSISLSGAEKRTVHLLLKLPKETFQKAAGKIPVQLSVLGADDKPFVLNTEIFGPLVN